VENTVFKSFPLATKEDGSAKRNSNKTKRKEFDRKSRRRRVGGIARL